MDKQLPNFDHMTAQDGKVYGIHDTVTSVNPYNCYFLVKYPGGKIIKGNNLFDTGWDDIPSGFEELSYVLSTGKVIPIPKFKAYLPLVECSLGVDGSRIFHAINVKCLTNNNEIINYKIILKQDEISEYDIGDIVMSKEEKPVRCSQWKMAAV